MTKQQVRAQADARALGDVPAQLAALETMTVGQLAKLWVELRDEPCRTRNKDYLRKRLAWTIQERAEGGLSVGALARIAQLGDGLPERWRMRQRAESGLPAPVPAAEPRDPRIPPPGTVLRRLHEGISHEVTVLAEGFAYAGETYKTLSAIAKHITGTPWNGFLFFGLKKRAPDGAQQEASR